MTNRVRSAWTTIERVLERELPSVARSLRPPASEQQLLELQQALGRTVPADLLESLRVHDGQDGSREHALFSGEWLLPTERILEYWTMRNGVQEDLASSPWKLPDWPISSDPPWWDSRYIPFTDSDGDAFCVDSSSAAGPVVQHVHDQGMDPAPQYASFIEFLEDLASCLDASRFTKKHGSLWPHRER